MVRFATAKDMHIRGPVGDWHALRSNPDYRADWRARGGAPSVVELAGFPLRAQTEADPEAARWGLLAWEPRERSRFKPSWIDEGMLTAEVEERGDPVGAIARAPGMSVTGLRLLDGALVLKVKWWRRVEQIRIPEGDSFDLERTVLALWYAFDGFPPTAAPRLCNFIAITATRRRPPPNR